MPGGRLECHLGGDASDCDRAHATVAQYNRQRRPLERGHRDLVEDDLAGARLELGNDLERRGAAQKRRAYLFGALDPLALIAIRY